MNKLATPHALATPSVLSTAHVPAAPHLLVSPHVREVSCVLATDPLALLNTIGETIFYKTFEAYWLIMRI